MASEGHPFLVEKFPEDPIEKGVDAISEGETTLIGRITEHIETAGIHSGDSACVLPPLTTDPSVMDEITPPQRPWHRS